MLLAAGAGLGELLCARERICLDRLDGFCTLVRHMTSQIKMFGLPYAEIIRECDHELLERCGIDAACGDDVCDFGTLTSCAREWLDEDCCRALAAVGEQVMCGQCGTLMSALDCCVSVLEAARGAEAARVENRCRVIRVLCLCGSALTALMLF